MSHWIERQIQGFHAMNEQSVVMWVGQEMAVREHGLSGKPEFYDPAVGYLQVNLLYVATTEGGRRISTYQNDADWGLSIQEDCGAPPRESHEPESIFRTRRIVELPLGRIEDVSLAVGDKGDVEKVSFAIGTKRIILEAGEVYEEWGGGLRVVRPDESILIAVFDS